MYQHEYENIPESELGIVYCPDCGKAMKLESKAQRTGSAIGGSVGTVAGFIGRRSAGQAGAFLGGAVGSLAKGSGRIAGGLVGALVGFFTGSAIGNRVGSHIDEHVICKYTCPSCGKTVTK